MTIIATYYSYEEVLETAARIANSIPPETLNAMQMVSEAAQQISEALAPVQEQYFHIQELITLVSRTDIKTASALNRINNEITDHPVESFVKLADAVEDFPESDFNYPDHESWKSARNSYPSNNDVEENSTFYNIRIFVKKQINQFKKEYPIEEIKVPDIEYCFNFFKFLFHSINTLCLIYGVYNDTFAYVFIEAVITNIDDILDLKK